MSHENIEVNFRCKCFSFWGRIAVVSIVVVTIILMLLASHSKNALQIANEPQQFIVGMKIGVCPPA